MKWQKHIGLDLGSTTIKVVQLAASFGGKFKLVAAGQVATPEFEDQAQWDLARTATVKKLIRDVHVSTNKVAISLPESLVYTRVIEMPALSEPDLASTIRWQAEQYIPVPLGDVVLKHQVLSLPDVGVPGSKMNVLLVAAPNSVLMRYSLLLANAGLEVVAIETEILAVARAIVEQGAVSPVTMLVHLGAEATAVAIFNGGLLMLSQSVPTGGAAVVRSVNSTLGLDMTQAMEYVKSYGLDETKLDGKVAAAIKPIIDSIGTEIKRAVAFYGTRSADNPVKRVVLSGGMALMPGLVEYFTLNFDLEAQVGNPLANLDLGSFAKSEVAEQACVFTAAVGLALKPI